MIKHLPVFLALTGPASATTYFNPVPFPLTDGTTGLSAQVNANFNQIRANGNAAQAAIQALITGLPAGTGMPSGAVIIVDTAACPSGYTISNGANGTADTRGVYIRGKDGSRTLGSYQADQIEAHTHTAPSTKSSLNPTATAGGTTNIIGNDTTVPAPGTGLMNGGLGGGETRPPTVVLLYCQKM